MACHPNILKSCALAFMLSAVVMPHSAPGQDFNLVFETRANDAISGLEVLDTPDGDLVVATSNRRIYWFDPVTSTWSEQLLPSYGRANDIEHVGDSTMFVPGWIAGLYVLSNDRSVFTADFVEPHWQWHSFTVAESGRWISVGDAGASWSDDAGERWSPVDTLFMDENSFFTSMALVRSLRGGVTFAWALTGISEQNFPKFYYSTDEGSTWSDSTMVARSHSLFWINSVLSTPEHVEIQIAWGKTHVARKTWADPMVEFTSDFVAGYATFSPMWGVIAASVDGLFLLDESNMSWSPFGGTQMAIGEVAASESGRIYVVEVGSRKIFRLDPIATHTEASDLEVSPDLVVYPNPSSNIIYVAGSRPTGKYVLYDILGRVVRKLDGADLISGTNIGDLAPGTYYLIEHSARTGTISTPAFFTKTGR